MNNVLSVRMMRPLRTLASVSLMSLAALVSCRSTVKPTSDPICEEYAVKYPQKGVLKLDNAEASKRYLSKTELTSDFSALSRSLYNTDKYAVCMSLDNGGAESPYDVSNVESGLGREYSVAHCKTISKLCTPIINIRKAASAPAASSSSAPIATAVPTAVASAASSASTPTASISASSGAKASKVFVSVSPASGPVGTVGSITVKVVGKIEESGEPSVSISGPSGIGVTGVTVLNGNTVKVDINLVDATPGSNAVIVSIGDKVIGTGSFRVFAPKAQKADAGDESVIDE